MGNNLGMSCLQSRLNHPNFSAEAAHRLVQPSSRLLPDQRVGGSLASIPPRHGVSRDWPLRWFDHCQREQKEGSEGATENCMKSVIGLKTVITPLVLPASSTCYPDLSACSFWRLDTVLPRRLECMKFFRSHHIARCLIDQYIERDFIHG